MKRTAAFLAVLCAASVAHADYSVSPEGTWPKSWPTQMEPLRKQARSLRGSLADITLYEIPFTKRAEFEAAWPHILKVKTKGAPVILVRSPDTWMGRIDAGVRIHCPPGKTGEPVTPGTPIAGAGEVTTRWLYTNYIELIVDGNIVDMNRIPLPPDMLIIDRRFNDRLTAWGMEVDGLQAGLGFRQGGDRAYSHGETVKLVVRVRNVGKEAAKFIYFREFFYENPPIVTDGDGKQVPVTGVMLSGWPEPVKVNLAPGKEIELSDLMNLNLRPASEKARDMPWTLYETGKFQLQCERLGGYTGAGGVKLDAVMSKLATGKLELQVHALTGAAGK